MDIFFLKVKRQTDLNLFLFLSPAGHIDCYKCDSKNRSDPYCGDPFHPTYSSLERRCQQGWADRFGMFPARYCTKIIGTSMSDGSETVIRSCAIETLENMCGIFELEGVRYSGCVMSCNTDACNQAQTPRPFGSTFFCVGISFLLIRLFDQL